jgi:hypothetical protein
LTETSCRIGCSRAIAVSPKALPRRLPATTVLSRESVSTRATSPPSAACPRAPDADAC